MPTETEGEELMVFEIQKEDGTSVGADEQGLYKKEGDWRTAWTPNYEELLMFMNAIFEGGKQAAIAELVEAKTLLEADDNTNDHN